VVLAVDTRGKGSLRITGAILLAAALAAAPPAPAAESPESGYRLGPETVPNGSFDRVAPKWQQLRPDEGEKLAVIPEGWLVGYQGGERRMPIPGKDPETGNRCMDFLFGAGRVDLVSPPFPMGGPGVYLLSLRTRSVVGPTDHALRAIVRFLPAAPAVAPEAGAAAPGKAAPAAAPDQIGIFETRIPAGPAERVWGTHQALVQVKGSFARAEVHLLKDDPGAEFLVDDVSLRRIEAAPSVIRLEIPSGAASWVSPVLYLGAAESASVEFEPAGSAAAVPIESRTGASADPGPAWEPWRRDEPGPSGSTARRIHLFARGLDLFAQIRVAGGDPPASGGILVRVAPRAGAIASSAVSLEAIDDPVVPGSEAWKSVILPQPGACTDGPLTPARALALDAIAGEADDLSRARALRRALLQKTPFSAGGDPPAKSPTPTPAALLADCARPTPLLCRGWRADLLTAACLCSGLVCRSVSSAAAGDPAGGLEGFEIWSRELNRWAYLSLAPDAVSEAAEPPDALQAASGRPVAVAMDLVWGLKGYVVHGDAPASGEGNDASLPRATAPREAIEFPINAVHADLEAAGERSFTVHLEHDMPGFSGYAYRLLDELPWRKVEGDLTWRLAPGDNLLEVRAENGFGGTSRVTRLTARLEADPGLRLAPYKGLRALSGDPHVHTGLGLYNIVDPHHLFATGSPEKAFESAVRNGLDWAAVSDFSQNIDDPRTIAWRLKDHLLLKNPDGTETASEWDHLKAVVRKANQPGKFAAFLGLEFDGGGFTSKGGTGRKIILLPDDSEATYCSSMVQVVGDCPLVEDAYRYARTHGGAVIASSPCSTLGLEDTDWSRYDPVVSLLEIFGGACETAPGGLREVVVDRRLPVGAAGGSDDRHGIAGKYDRTICWAPEVTRSSILDAIRARRCYWSAAGHLDLAFTVNGAAMGATAGAGTETSWSVVATNRTAPAFSTVEILKDGAVIASAPCESAARCSLAGGLGEAWPGVYYAAIDAADGGRLALSSPITIAAEPAP